ncbi:MAG: YbaK/EbsC family protein [Candidatus Tectomicrobia bacterium]|nr:YbaK/EbsC family protein [Candidatus Tectomicrobia bacterium]
MPIAAALQRYLARQGIEYEAVPHSQAFSASRIAQASHVPGDRGAKAVVLKGEGGYCLAVLPASRRLQVDELRDSYNLLVEMATEKEIGALFQDCELGAIPPIGAAYGLEAIVDESLPEEGEVYFEAGDHATLLRVAAGAFRKLMGDVKRGRFSART